MNLPMMCKFWEGPMHDQNRTVDVSCLVDGLLEVVECPPGEINRTPKPLLIHVYKYSGGNTLGYQGVKPLVSEPKEQTPPDQP